MKRVLLTMVYAASIVLVGMVRPASAGSITFTLDCDINGSSPGTCYDSTFLATNAGTITITDATDLDLNADPNTVVITVDLVDPSVAQSFDLNYLDYLGASPTLTATGTDGDFAVSYGSNDQQADGYSGSKFDIELPKNGVLGLGDPFTITLAATGFDLDAAKFNVLSYSSAAATPLYAAVQKTSGGGWVGSLTSCADFECVQFIPEPASSSLFSFGLATACGYAIRRRRAGRGSHR